MYKQIFFNIYYINNFLAYNEILLLSALHWQTVFMFRTENGNNNKKQKIIKSVLVSNIYNSLMHLDNIGTFKNLLCER